MELELLYQKYKECNFEVSTDTRSVKEGSLFFALSGANFNGNNFISEALGDGCKYAVCDDGSVEGDNVINVGSSLLTLQQLANYHRSKFEIPVLGITGSNGKTTTKELLAEVLMKKYNLLYTKGNLNNHIGVPLTLLGLREGHDFALIEMGANKPGDIKELCEIADPTHGMITNIGTAHIEGFGSREGVVKTKSEMYDFVIHKQGVLFINNNEKYLKPLLNNYSKTIEFGGDDINFKIDSSKYELELDINGVEIRSKLFGQYNANNILTAYAVGKYFEIEEKLIVEAIENYKPNNNRSQIKISSKENHLILDAYNANPSSLNLAIEELLSKEGEKLFIVGDMRELGHVSEEEHKKIIDKLINSNSRAILVGEEFKKYNYSDFLAFTNVDELIKSGALENLNGIQILVKGSRGVQLEKLEPFL